MSNQFRRSNTALTANRVIELLQRIHPQCRESKSTVNLCVGSVFYLATTEHHRGAWFPSRNISHLKQQIEHPSVQAASPVMLQKTVEQNLRMVGRRIFLRGAMLQESQEFVVSSNTTRSMDLL